MGTRGYIACIPRLQFFALTSLHRPHPQVGQTTLYIPVGLQAVYGDAKNWAFQGGFIGWVSCCCRCRLPLLPLLLPLLPLLLPTLPTAAAAAAGCCCCHQL